MRCIFCKTGTVSESTREHIIPESIGNTRHVLPAGFVCGRCNNYFAREIEGPLLRHESFRNLRARFQVPTKKGRIPSMRGFLLDTELSVGMRVAADGSVELRPERHSETDEIHARLYGKADDPSIIIFPCDMNPPKREMSRLLAKMALETVARRLAVRGSLDRFIDESHYDLIRRWTRHGDNLRDWPFHQRQIHPEETYMRHPTTGLWVRAGYSHDLFITKRWETFFVFCLYGHEFVINVGGPSIKGYEEWLEDHNGISPVIERVGFQLQQGLECGEYYLVGDCESGDGAKFDRELSAHWPTDR